MLQNLCTPALIYLIFSITQITIDIFKKDYNVALVKFTVAFIFTILLNYLCSSGLGIVSWIIVFIPFILMTYITAVLMFVFGLNPKSDNLDYDVKYPDDYPDELLVVRNPTINVNTNNNNEYDPDDYTSGTPEDINNYN